MKIILLIAFIFLFIKLEAQNIVISFSNAESNGIIDSVLVENLFQGKSIVVPGSNNIELTALPVTSVPIYGISSQIKVYPNPVSDYCFLQFKNNEAGNVTVGLYDLTGKRLISQTMFLESGVIEFQLSGLPCGIFMLKIVGTNFNFTNKIISINNESTDLDLKYFHESYDEQIPTQLKSTTANVLMQYNTGERLKYTFYSGKNATIQTDVPTQSKTVSANFYVAKDADGNSYATVQIGTQIWMAENLKTTKYRNGEPISNVTNKSQWNELSIKPSSAQCTYNNDDTNSNKYGRLYNWYAVNDSRNIAPSGWHVPSDGEWTLMTDYLDTNYNIFGPQAKTLAASIEWPINSPVFECISNQLIKNNISGFTALPGGFRWEWGEFVRIGYGGYLWSSTEKDTSTVWRRLLDFEDRPIVRGAFNKCCGLSVRCVKD